MQCSECLLNWNEGIVFGTCGHLFKESEASQHFQQWRLDAFSIENYVIKKGCSARQNWSTERAFHSPQCSKEMSRKEIWRNSRSLPKTLGWTIWPTVCAHKCDENTYTFDRWSFARRSIARVPRTEWTSCHNKIVWLNFVLMQDSWQRLMSDSISWRSTLKKSHNLQEPVTCREYTSPRDETSTDPKGWIRVNTKIGPVLEVATCCLQGKYGVEIRIESVTKDISHSWVRISHGLTSWSRTWTTRTKTTTSWKISEMQFEEFALETNVLASGSRPKARAKPRRCTPASSSTKTIPTGDRKWTDIEPEYYSPIAYPMSK